MFIKIDHFFRFKFITCKKCVLILLYFSIGTNAFADNWIQAYSELNRPSFGFISTVLSDNQIVFGGHNSNDEAILMLADKNGNIKASKKLANCKYLKVVLETNDKNIFVCGITDTTGSQGNNIFWMKLDLNFNIIWSKQNFRAFNDIVESAIQHTNGSFFLVGYGSRSGNELSDRDALIYNVDASGDLISSIISNNYGTDYFNNVIELPDGNIVVAGAKLWQVAMDFYMVKYSPNLSTLVSKTLGGVDNEAAYDLIIKNGALYVLGGSYSYGAGGFDALLSKMDFDLNVEFTKAYGQTSDEYPTTLIALENEFIITGNLDTIIVLDSVIVPIKSFFIKTDLDGNIISSKILDRQSIINNINAISYTSNNELVGVMSSTKFTSVPNTAIILFKTDSFSFKCCDYFQTKYFIQTAVNVNSRSQTFSFNNAGAIKPLNSSTSNYSIDKVLNCGPLDDSSKIIIENRPYCIAEAISMSAINSVPPNSFTWIAGDSTTNTIKEPTYSFDTAGTYLIYYIANYNCNSDTDTLRVTIVKEIPYEVYLSRNGYCMGKPISFFVDSSTSTIIKYKWDFGISSLLNDTSNLQNPTYTFTQPGTYNVKVFTLSECGSKTDSITITIEPLNSASIEPNAITYCKNSTIPFVINANTLPNSVLWNFGDINNSNNTSININETFIYNKPGFYVCTLISNYECNSDTDTMHIYIVDHFPVSTKIEYIGYCSSEPFSFLLENSLSNESYIWEIVGPDNFTYYSKSFTHQFSKGGRYTVYSSVADNNCNLGLDTLELFVAPFIEAQIETTNDVCLAGTVFNSVNFSEELLWKLSDGHISRENKFIHNFENTGNYTVTLITNPNSACEDSIVENISVVKENIYGGIYFPEIISPNDDGKNDVFYIENTTNNPCKIEELKIFDRWGKVMFSAEKFESYIWDGKLNGSAVTPGAYIAFLKTDLYSKSFLIHVVY